MEGVDPWDSFPWPEILILLQDLAKLSFHNAEFFVFSCHLTVLNISTFFYPVFERVFSRVGPQSSFFLSYFDIFLFTHRRCRGLFLHLITLRHTHTKSIRLLWTRDRLVAESSVWRYTIFIRNRNSCLR